MKKLILILSLAFIATSANCQEKFLVGGTSSKNIVIIDKQSKSAEWTFAGVNGEVKECNSLIRLDDGGVAYTFKKGLNVVTPQGERVWSYQVNEGEEMQSISAIKGGYMVGIAGTPTRIIELNKKWEITKEITYNTGVENVHRQFRQMAKSKKGTYIIPVGLSKKIIELNSRGELIKEVQLEQQSLYVMVQKDGDWIATTGHGGDIYKINGKSGEISTIVSGKDLGDGVNIEFGAGIIELKNGNYMLTNWVGHNGDQTQPILIELDKTGKVVWSMNKLPEITFAAGIFPIY